MYEIKSTRFYARALFLLLAHLYPRSYAAKFSALSARSNLQDGLILKLHRLFKVKVLS